MNFSQLLMLLDNLKEVVEISDRKKIVGLETSGSKKVDIAQR